MLADKLKGYSPEAIALVMGSEMVMVLSGK